jgi:predicted SAM-dependent methyltransferase
VKLDLGCGTRKEPGFIGVDERAFPGVDVVADLSSKWPWPDTSVDEVNCSHMIEHLTGPQRIHFFNELFRVLKPGAKARIITPHWASCRAYGDLTHQWPPVTEFFWSYLNAEWRKVNAPHSAHECDFDAGYGYTLNPLLNGKNDEYRQYAIGNFKEAAQDMVCTLTRR